MTPPVTRGVPLFKREADAKADVEGAVARKDVGADFEARRDPLFKPVLRAASEIPASRVDSVSKPERRAAGIARRIVSTDKRRRQDIRERLSWLRLAAWDS